MDKLVNVSKILLLGTLFLTVISAVTVSHSTKSLPDVGTKQQIGQVNGLDIEVMVQSPAARETPLQIICLFEYVEGDVFTSPPALSKDLNGIVHVDQAFNGLITELRKTQKFEGKFLETLLITPSANTIPAKKLLLIGLGDRNDFKPEMMRVIGVIGMREALRLGVASYTHASDLKDAGIDSPTADVAGYVAKGAIEAFQVQGFLKKQNASDALTVTRMTLLAGPAFYEETQQGIKDMIDQLTK